MQKATIVILGLSLLAGCDSLRTSRVDNPVMPEAPPRVALQNDSEYSGDAYINDPLDPKVNGVKPGEAVPVSYSNSTSTGENDFGHVVATVNGEPIFAADVLARYGTNLAKVKAEAPPFQYRQLRDGLLKRDLNDHIDRVLLVQQLKSTLEPAQMEQVEIQLGDLFEKEIDKLMERFGANSKVELHQMLHENNMTLATLKEAFTNQRLAMEYLRQKVDVPQKIGREELYAYYQKNIDDYKIQSKVRWQQILVSHKEHGGKEAAKNVLVKAIDELRRDIAFDEVAKKYSDGPTANNGGNWDWTEPGSLEDTEIERALFELPVGSKRSISRVFEREDDFQLVRVVERQDTGFTKFEVVQNEIRDKLLALAREEQSKSVIAELREEAVIETEFDAENKPTVRSVLFGQAH